MLLLPHISGAVPFGVRSFWLGLLTTGSLLFSTSAQAFEEPPLPDPRVPVVFKVDDMTATGKGGVPERWKRLTDFARERKIKLAIGVIAKSLEGDNPAYLDYLKGLQASGLVEFWFHGYDHGEHTEDGRQYAEFANRPYEEQKRRFQLSQQLAREKLGTAFVTFGQPGGGNTPASDADWAATMRAFADDSDLKIWMYPRALDPAAEALQKEDGVVILDRVSQVNIENPLFVPNLTLLARFYARLAAGRKYYILQGHPNQWDDARWAEFVKIVDFLQQNNIPIVFPSALAAPLAK